MSLVMKQDYCNIPVKVPVFSRGQNRELVSWLRNNIDHRDYDYSYLYFDTYDNTVTVFFAKKKDAVLFTLRWS